MFRYILVLAGVYAACCVLAYGQQTPSSQQTPGGATASANAVRERPIAAHAPAAPEADSLQSVMRRNGNSLLRTAAAMQTNGGNGQADPTKVALRAVSPYAVPEPEAKFFKKHDQVTIIIREESETSNQGTSDLKRSSELEATVDQFVRLNLANMALENSIAGTAPTIKMSGSRNFKGEATVDRTDSFIARIQAEVLDVKPNGTLVLQARKKIKNDDEEQTYVCSGICRVEDITPDNTVLSTQIFDLEVSKTTKGQVRSTTKKGVIGKLLDFINPF